MKDADFFDKPVLSIVTPVYNTEKYLPECIDSILRQTFTKFELILIDDGSTDSSGKIADEYSAKDERIRVIHQKNMGAVHAKLGGVRESKAGYITFVDSDDWIDADMLEVLLAPMLDNDETDISVSPHIRNDGAAETFTFKRCQKHEVFGADEAIRIMFQNKRFSWTMCGKIYRRELFDGLEVSFPDVAYGEDIEISWKVFSRAKKVYYQPRPMYHYRQHGESMVHRFDTTDRTAVLERIKLIMDESDDKELTKIMARLFSTTGVDNLLGMLQHCDYEDAPILKKYQKMLPGYYRMINEPLTPTQERCYKYALMDMDELRQFLDEQENKLIKLAEDFCRRHEKVFIYGTGKIAGETAALMEKNGIEFDGFAVSQDVNGTHLKRPLMYFRDVIEEYGEKCGFILALNEKNQAEVTAELEKIPHTSWMSAGVFSLNY